MEKVKATSGESGGADKKTPENGRPEGLYQNTIPGSGQVGCICRTVCLLSRPRVEDISCCLPGWHKISIFADERTAAQVQGVSSRKNGRNTPRGVGPVLVAVLGSKGRNLRPGALVPFDPIFCVIWAPGHVLFEGNSPRSPWFCNPNQTPHGGIVEAKADAVGAIRCGDGYYCKVDRTTVTRRYLRTQKRAIESWCEARGRGMVERK